MRLFLLIHALDKYFKIHILLPNPWMNVFKETETCSLNMGD